MVVNLDFNSLLKEARLRAEKMVSNGLYSRFGLSYQARIDKALLGCLGELGFEAYLKQKNIPYQIDESDFTETHTDLFDFLINHKKIDVKVAKKSTSRPPSDGWTYGYPAEQKPLSKDFIVVGWVDFTLAEIGFYGWTTGLAISRCNVVEQNSFAGYKYLTPNHEFKWGSMNKDFEALFKAIGLF